MALISRASIIGASEHLLSENVGRLTTKIAPGSLAVGRATPPVPAPAPDGVGSAAVAQAAAVPTPPPGLGAIVTSFAAVVAGTVGAYVIWSVHASAAVIHPEGAASVFGIMLLLAGAVERVLEPFTRWLPGSQAPAELESTVATAANQSGNVTHADLVAVAHANARAGKARASRAVLLWGIATSVATIASSICGFYVLHAIAGPSWTGISVWGDALVTGLLVGSGTKPLHDLITMVQSKSE